MFGWMKRKRIKKAQAVLTRHINQKAMQGVKGIHRSPSARTSICKVVHLIPLSNGGSWKPADAESVVTHNISAGGLSIIHREPVGADRVIVGIPEGNDVNFIKCHVEYTTKLAEEFYQIGLNAEDVANVNFRKVTAFKKTTQFENASESVDLQKSINNIMDYWDENSA